MAMVPAIFVSSTIEDLKHLREVIRDSLEVLGYSAVMSEFGEIPFPSDISVEDACYRAIQSCQMAILIVGKRYGSRGQNDLSITHNEARVARKLGIHLMTFVDNEVMGFKRVYDVNIRSAEKKAKKKLIFPGMDDPAAVFALIDEIRNADRNNGIHSFTSAKEARDLLRRQFAYLMYSSLKSRP